MALTDSAVILLCFRPRGSAVAERLWSAEDVKDANAAEARLEEHRCRLIRFVLSLYVKKNLYVVLVCHSESLCFPHMSQ